MRLLFLVALAVLMALFLNVRPAGAQNFDEPDKAAQRFCDLLMAQGADRAVNAMKGGSFLGRHRPGAFELWREGLAKADQATGSRLLGCEVLAAKRLGSVVREERAIVKYEVGPALLILRYYKPAAAWQLNSFSWIAELEKFPVE
jgi:hypothetical protein